MEIPRGAQGVQHYSNVRNRTVLSIEQVGQDERGPGHIRQFFAVREYAETVVGKGGGVVQPCGSQDFLHGQGANCTQIKKKIEKIFKFVNFC